MTPRKAPAESEGESFEGVRVEGIVSGLEGGVLLDAGVLTGIELGEV